MLECLTGLELEPGEHTIKMVYFPDCVKYGLIISGCSLGLFILIIIGELILRRKFPLIVFSSSAIPAGSDAADAGKDYSETDDVRADGSTTLITVTELTVDSVNSAGDGDTNDANTPVDAAPPDADGENDDDSRQS